MYLTSKRICFTSDMFNKNIQSAEIADCTMKSGHLVGRVLFSESRGGIRLLLQTESWPLAGGGGRGDHLPSEPPLVPPCQFGRRQTNGAVCLPVSTRSKAHADRWTKRFSPDDKMFGIFYDWDTMTSSLSVFEVFRCMIFLCKC